MDNRKTTFWKYLRKKIWIVIVVGIYAFSQTAIKMRGYHLDMIISAYIGILFVLGLWVFGYWIWYKIKLK